jgi:hypothetical protein
MFLFHLVLNCVIVTTNWRVVQEGGGGEEAAGGGGAHRQRLQGVRGAL